MRSKAVLTPLGADAAHEQADDDEHAGPLGREENIMICENCEGLGYYYDEEGDTLVCWECFGSGLTPHPTDAADGAADD